jgi:hypothetical protein
MGGADGGIIIDGGMVLRMAYNLALASSANSVGQWKQQ